MKKLVFYAAAFAAVALASCNGKTNANTEGVDSTEDTVKVFVQANIEAGIKANLDSLAKDLTEHNVESFGSLVKNGKISLTDDEKKVKPDYLVEPTIADNLTTMSDRYRALMILEADKAVAGLYGMDVEAYEAATAKLVAEIGDPVLKKLQESDENPAEQAQFFYEEEEKAGRINFFWEAVCAGTVEQLYIMCQNTETFVDVYSDEAISNITLRIALIQDALERLSEYAPELIDICEAIKPLEKLNATNASELRSQLESMKADITTSREALLK